MVGSLFIGTELLLPYLLKPTRLSVGLRLEQYRAKSFLERMKPQYWAGYFLLPFC
jgi:hypothetical protein